MDESVPDIAIAIAVMERILADRGAGRTTTLADLTGMYPGCEAAVAAAFARALEIPTTADVQGSTGGATKEPSLAADLPRQIGPYRIEDELGRGAQGVVYRATDVRLGRTVALKVLLGSWAASPQALRRFENEARMLAGLDDPGLCTVFEASASDGLPYIAMRYVAGESLLARLTRARIARNGDLPSTGEIAGAVVLIERVARAVHAAHEAGVIHRDLKPANIMVSATGEPTVLDFGLAHGDDEDGPAVTATGDILGTPAYMAPEQALGQPRAVDRRADVHALAVMLYELTVGRRPFDGPTRSAIIDAVCTRDAPDARRVHGGIAVDLATILQRGLAKRPPDRYASAGDLADDLRRFRMHEPIAARPLGFVARTVRWIRRKPVAAALIVTATLLLIAVVSFLVWYLANRDRLAEQAAAEARATIEDLLGRGSTALASRRKPDARRAFERVLALEPACVEAAAALPLCVTTPDEARAEAERLDAFIAAYGGSPAVLVARARLPGAKTTSESRSDSRRGDELRDDVSCYVLAMAELSSGIDSSDVGALDRAAQLLETAIQRAPARRPLYLHVLAMVVGRTNRTESARRIADTVRLVIGGGTGELLAGFALSNCDPTAALSALHRAKTLGVESLDAGYGISTTLTRQGRFDEAAAALRELIADHPDDATLYYNLALVESDRHRPQAALGAAQKALDLRPDVAANHGNLAFVLRDQFARHDEALSAFSKAMSMEPSNMAWPAQIAITYTLANQPAKAVEFARTALAGDPRQLIAWRALGRGLRVLGLLDEAEKAARTAIELAPGMAYLRFELVRVLVTARKLTDARAEYDAWKSEGPSCGKVFEFATQELTQAEAARDLEDP